MPPARRIHLVHALVANLAIAVFPEIVPVVVNIEARFFPIRVDHVFMIGRWALP